MNAGRARKGSHLPAQLLRPRAGQAPAGKPAAAKSKKEGEEDLPSGWVRVASRSKPGAFFYAHPATKRTQAERPGSERKAGPARPRHSDRLRAAEAEDPARPSDAPQLVEVPDPPSEKLVVDLEDDGAASVSQAAVKREKARADAEVEEAAREAALQKARERRARAAQAEQESGQQEGSASASTSAPVAAAKPSAGKSRRAGVRAGAADESLAKKRKKAWQKDAPEEDDEGITQEDLDRWKEENEWRETSTEEASGAEDAKAGKAGPGQQGAEARQRESVPEPEEIFEPCLDVLKSGLWVERHPFVEPKQQWQLGRATGQVDVPMQHESISRNHAVVIRQGAALFIADLGSAHGTLLDGCRLRTNTLMRLQSGAQLRFGASTRLYVFHEPPP